MRSSTGDGSALRGFQKAGGGGGVGGVPCGCCTGANGIDDCNVGSDDVVGLNSRLVACGVPLGDQIPFVKVKKKIILILAYSYSRKALMVNETMIYIRQLHDMQKSNENHSY